MVAACSVPDFEFPEDPQGPGLGGGGNVVPPADHCENGRLDEDLGESDFDCGGGCSPCAAGQRCATVADCEDELCHDGICIAAGCINDVQDGTETDVDCGGGRCGACNTGQSCAQDRDCASEVCVDGECLAPACDDQIVNGKETGLDCGGDCPPCPADEPCLVGRDCASSECNDGVCGSECQDGFANCDQDNSNECEVNTRTDLENCGACGNACDLPHAVAECSAGECRIVEDGCEPGYFDCNGDPEDGCEIHLETNRRHCGACNKACNDINGTPSCVAGECQITCKEGFEDCDDNRDNGCEVNLNSSVRNCGECGEICSAMPGNSAKCTAGVCGETPCPAGKGDCEEDPQNVCETTLTNDVKNCGGCGIECVAANADVACVNSQCVITSCKPGYADCNGGYANGCETDTTTSLSHCGGCGKTCSVDNGSPKCEDGSCEVSSCSGTFRDCDGDPKNGCEINIATNTQNCGGCGAAGNNCATKYPNATSTCVAGACTAPTCKPGWGDCSGGTTDGCETNTTNSGLHCGGCNQVCSTSASAHVTSNACSNSQCNPVCSPEYASCDNNKLNGCEVSTGDDEANCGGCGLTCSTAPSAHVTANLCTGGDCSPTCAGTYRNCDGNGRNGCEVDSATNASHCGACGRVCSTAASAHVSSNQCSGGNCNPVCAGLYDDCDGNPQNGCETSVAADKNNCGGCDIVCGTQNASSTTCSSGTCNPTCNAGWGKCASPELGCVTPLGTTSNCSKCGESCSGSTPFCDPGGCVAFRNIVVVNSATSSVSSGWVGGHQGPTQLRVNHTLGSAKGASRMLLVGVVASDNMMTPVENIAVSYGGTPMLNAVKIADGQKQSFSGIYYLLDAALPNAAGAVSEVKVVFKDFPEWGHGGLHVVELRNVMQVAPLTTGSAVGTGCNQHATRSATVSYSQAGTLVYGLLSGRGATKATLEPATNLVQSWYHRWQASPQDHVGAAAIAFPDDDGRTISWDVENCYNSAATAVAIKRLSAN